MRSRSIFRRSAIWSRASAQAFLADASGERAETVKAEVCLSSEEANRGAVVPVDVLLRATCSQCGGRGETWAELLPGVRRHRPRARTAARLRVTVPARASVDGS